MTHALLAKTSWKPGLSSAPSAGRLMSESCWAFEVALCVAYCFGSAVVGARRLQLSALFIPFKQV
jgi:hypothetical protein